MQQKAPERYTEPYIQYLPQNSFLYQSVIFQRPTFYQSFLLSSNSLPHTQYISLFLPILKLILEFKPLSSTYFSPSMLLVFFFAFHFVSICLLSLRGPVQKSLFTDSPAKWIALISLCIQHSITELTFHCIPLFLFLCLFIFLLFSLVGKFLLIYLKLYWHYRYSMYINLLLL